MKLAMKEASRELASGEPTIVPGRAATAMAWLLALALAPSAVQADDTLLSANERDALEIVVRTPYAIDSKQALSPRFLAIADRVLRAHTSLFARLAVDSPELDEARGDTSAIQRGIRRDADPAELARRHLGAQQHEAALFQAGERPARFVAVLTLLPDGKEIRISASLIDVSSALEILATFPPTNTVEDRFADEGVVIRPPPASTAAADEGARDAYVEDLFHRAFEPIFSRRKVGNGPATIALSGVIEGGEIRLDGHAIGLAGPDLTRIAEVRAGKRRVSVEVRKRGRFDTDVEVTGGATIAVDAALLAGVGGEAPRDVVRWSGWAAAAGGVVLVTWGIIASATADPLLQCNDATGTFERCPSAPWQRFGSAGPAIVPLGYSLASAGLVWSLGPDLVEREGDVPWLSVLAGTALGVAAYAISVALEPDQKLSP